MKTIPLTCGKVALVDDEWFDRLNKHNWQAVKMGRKGHTQFWYAVRKAPAYDGKRRAIFMHREVSGAKRGWVVNHRDFDGLNNQNINLDVCTYAENSRYRRRKPRASSRFKGVSWNRFHKLWVARIASEETNYYLGSFDDELAAARAYNAKAKELFGDFAYLNSL